MNRPASAQCVRLLMPVRLLIWRRSVGPKAASTGVELICDVDPGLGGLSLLGDAFRVRQCLLNIVGAPAGLRPGACGRALLPLPQQVPLP